MLQDGTQPKVVAMREKILSKLKRSTGGDFRKISTVLDNISRTDEIPEINSHLESAANASADQIDMDIAQLDQTKSPKEISDINEMILWTISAIEWLRPLELEAALTLKAVTTTGDGPQPTASQTTTLSSLESKIRKDRYPDFQTRRRRRSYVEFKVDLETARERIPKKKQDTIDDKSSSGVREIQLAEVNLVKHYLTTVCPRDVYDKFGFDDFFSDKLVRKTNYIYQDPDNAHITLALRCLTSLVERRVDTTEALHRYAATYLLRHLSEAERDGRLSVADRGLRVQVGTLLARLFTEDYAIDSLFGIRYPLDNKGQSALEAGEIPLAWRPWVVTGEGPKLLTKYFKDRAVLESIQDCDFVKAFDAAGDDRLFTLLKPRRRRPRSTC